MNWSDKYLEGQGWKEEIIQLNIEGGKSDRNKYELKEDSDRNHSLDMVPNKKNMASTGGHNPLYNDSKSKSYGYKR